MKWTICSSIAIQDSRIVGLKRTDQVLVGRWKSKEMPKVGYETYAEIDIDIPIEEIDIEEMLQESFDLDSNNVKNIISGLIESIDDDLIHFLRISDDCLIMLEARKVKLNVGQFYRLTVPVESTSITPC